MYIALRNSHGSLTETLWETKRVMPKTHSGRLRRNKKILSFPVSRPTHGQNHRPKKFSRTLIFVWSLLFIIFIRFSYFFSLFIFMQLILYIYYFHEIKLECYINGYSTTNHTEELLIYYSEAFQFDRALEYLINADILWKFFSGK